MIKASLVSILFCLGLVQASPSKHLRQDSQQTVWTSFFDLLNGLKADDYVPGTFSCAENVQATYVDYTSVQTYFSADNESNRPTDAKERTQEAVFTMIKSFTANLPGSIYNCYFIPMMSSYRWRGHYAKFQDNYDFWAGFAQNLMGNALTIEFSLGQMNEALALEDNTTVIYEFGRLIRRIFDFEPIKSGSNTSKRL